MKTKAILVGLMALMCFAMLVPAVFARDSRYDSHWDVDIFLDEGSIVGDWELFYVQDYYWHPPETYAYFTNTFAEEIDYTSGFYGMHLKWYPWFDTMVDADSEVLLKIWADDEADGCGAYVKIEFFNTIGVMKITLFDMWNNQHGSSYTINYNDWMVTLEFRVMLSYTANPNRNFQFYAYMGKYSYETQTTTRLEGFTLGSDQNIPLQNGFTHGVEVSYGPSCANDGRWVCGTNTLTDVGIRPDISYEDCQVNMRDMGQVSRDWGSKVGVGGIDYDDWFFNSTGGHQYWKSDIDVNCWVNSFDTGWVGRKYGQSW